jgi:alpha-D-ribose 1-methylphosphonate 5-phosphate C-P lyase
MCSSRSSTNAHEAQIRRKILRAIAIPGYQVPDAFAPSTPIARGWGTGGLHASLSIIGPDDVFKIIDQGSDASVNACNLTNSSGA